MTSISFLSPIAYDQANAEFARARVAGAIAGYTSGAAHPPSPASPEVHQIAVKAAEAAADDADARLRLDQAKQAPPEASPSTPRPEPPRLDTHA